VGIGRYVRVDHALVHDLMMRDPDARSFVRPSAAPAITISNDSASNDLLIRVSLLSTMGEGVL
jgi:hypothetical protein